jgi:large subunit ribosomal protein L1
MSKRGKKYRGVAERAFEDGSWKEALDFVVQSAFAKFDESVDVDIALGIDPTKGEQNVRGAVLLPFGTGKKVRVVAFVKGEGEDAAKAAGADFVGSEELVEKIQGGWLDFDASVATPDMMPLIGKVARILGPRGLLPNKKVGTVAQDVVPVIKELKKGRVEYRNDKGGIVHASFGKVSFGSEKLLENLEALVRAVRASKPPSSKGKFIKKISVSSTMGVGVALSADEKVVK